MACYRSTVAAEPVEELEPLGIACHFEIDGRRVWVWYDLLQIENVTVDDELRADLRSYAEEVVSAALEDGRTYGGICCNVPDDEGGDADIYGHWGVDN